MKTIIARKTFNEYRAAFALRGTTIRGWARDAGVNVHSAYDALKGARTGPGAQKIIRKADRYLSN